MQEIPHTDICVDKRANTTLGSPADQQSGGIGGAGLSSAGGAIVRAIWRVYIRLAHALGGIEATNRLLAVVGQGRTSTVLRRYGATIGEGDRILSPLILHNAEPDYRNLTAGRDCYIGKDVLLDLTDSISLGDGVTISMRGTIVTHMDVGRSALRAAYPARSGAVRIADGAYLGAGAIVLAGVYVGANSVVAAGAVVTRDVPEWTVVAGVPAQVVKSIQTPDLGTVRWEPRRS